MTQETIATSLDPVLLTRVEQFYYREARLLDERCYKQWLALLDEAIEYLMPGRYVPQPDSALRNEEAGLAVDRELQRYTESEAPLRQENLFHLAIRADRPYKINAWAENPPPRTRRMVSNVEVLAAGGGVLSVYSNFTLFYSHRGMQSVTYTGCRRDKLRQHEDGFRLLRREVILDWDVIEGPTVGLLF